MGHSPQAADCDFGAHGQRQRRVATLCSVFSPFSLQQLEARFIIARYLRKHPPVRNVKLQCPSRIPRPAVDSPRCHDPLEQTESEPTTVQRWQPVQLVVARMREEKGRRKVWRAGPSRSSLCLIRVIGCPSMEDVLGCLVY
ncbi:hypothetical protein CORC01_04632 [Colletotrichum orchidophilum]|uniref:Uncharacterized protein n=1 Tax=Colletotrichum orchidophilum TaxID=1209926 RepID=A0A1G4BF52_9PEZI|nr:uncharacterized protein CORC01_04632 [Colletotrichum orchidophilum]OHE99985.1 hypothetical protein CORC01_04632 [Colletotrichum orchidophilum]